MRPTVVSLLACCLSTVVLADIPIVINTWDFTDATAKAWDVLNGESKTPALDAVEQGCSTCEELRCGGTVGYGGSPDEEGEVSLDALIMDGTTMEAGAVAALRHVKQAVTAARLVMERTYHTMLAGLQATSFAMEMGLGVANLSTPESNTIYRDWKANNCQPNFRRRVTPDPSKHCGPYSIPNASRRQHTNSTGGDWESQSQHPNWVTEHNHDTISMIAIDVNGNIAVATSTNGASHKLSGRIGDGAVVGAGAYGDSDVGGCGATGDGDVHLRFLPCYQVVEYMRNGIKPKAACEKVLSRIAAKYPNFLGALVAVDRKGNHGAAAYGWKFSYSYVDALSPGVQVVTVDPIKPLTQRLQPQSGGSDVQHQAHGMSISLPRTVDILDQNDIL